METLAVGRFLALRSIEYGRLYYEIIENQQPCPYCDDNDYYVMEVATDNDFSLKEGVLYPEDSRAGTLLKVCEKRLEKDLKENWDRISVQPESDDEFRREAIAYNNK